jgi:hypothetical protein
MVADASPRLIVSLPIQMPLMYERNRLFITGHSRVMNDNELGLGAGRQLLPEFEVSLM